MIKKKKKQSKYIFRTKEFTTFKKMKTYAYFNMGVDTDEKKATIDNIIANTKNEETKNKLMEVQTNLLKIQETESNMSRDDRMYEIKMRMRKTTEEVRQLSRSNEILVT